MVMALLASANRDPAEFDDPDRYDNHLAFSKGSHFCSARTSRGWRPGSRSST